MESRGECRGELHEEWKGRVRQVKMRGREDKHQEYISIAALTISGNCLEVALS